MESFFIKIFHTEMNNSMIAHLENSKEKLIKGNMKNKV